MLRILLTRALLEGLPDVVPSPAATGDNDNLFRHSEHRNPPQNELVHSPKPVLDCGCCITLQLLLQMEPWIVGVTRQKQKFYLGYTLQLTMSFGCEVSAELAVSTDVRQDL